ncbi:VCBS repeat-containing protein, partial [Mesorhizobium sp. NFR06]|uniref:beta strand repeat-containing protein n=1 Tax=Mesorhizobium sp. NFR06 TaxID=1566290 RepID=UPI0008E6EAA6
MTNNIEFDAVSNSWDEHSTAGENPISTGIQVAQAASGQPASEPVPVDVGSGAPAQGAANAPATNQPAADANAPASNAPASNANANAPTGNAPAANAAASNVPHEYHAEAGNVVKLPANVSIDNIKVDGHNLVLVQPDGSEIVIKDGALNVPTFILGDVEVPRVALIAALEASHVDVAFGADGSISAGGNGAPGSAGGNFEQPPGGIGDGFGLTALLPPTDLAFGQPEHRELFPGLLPDSTPTILDLTPSVEGGDTIVDEKGLPVSSGSEGSGEAQNPAPNSDQSEINSGTFTVNSPDGIGSLNINGQVISAAALANSGSTPIEITTPLGNTLTINGYDAATGQVSYTYTLLHSEPHPGAGTDSIFDNMTVTVTDSDGDVSLPGTLSVQIVDDVPTANADTDAVPSGSHAPIDGNVITGAGSDGNAGGADIQGADGASVTSAYGKDGAGSAQTVTGAGVSIAGEYGTLLLHSDGTYTYTRAAETKGGVDDVFHYTLTDGDGDQSSTTLTISIGNTPPTIDGLTPEANGGDVTVNEAALNAGTPGGPGSDPASTAETGTGTFTIASPDGIASLTIDGHAFITNGVFTADSFTTALGNTLNVTGYNAATGEVSYTYTLLDNEAHDPVQGTNNLFENFTVSLTDQDGQNASSTLSVDILDDVPTAKADTDAAQSGEKVTGNVETGASTHGTGAADTAGADGIASIAWTGSVTSNGVTTVTGAHGVLTVFANGDYSYQATPNAPTGTDVFNYTITDGDGDTSSATLTIDVTGSQPRVVAEVAAVNEAGIDTTPPAGDLGPGTVDGSHAGDGSETTTGTLTFADPDGATVTGVASGNIGSDVSGNVGTNINGTYGILHVNADGTYTYTLTSPEANVPAGNDGANVQPGQDVFTFTVTDGLGNTSTSTISINITDDVPTITNAVVGSSVTLDETNNGPTTDGVLNPAIMTATSAAAIVTLTSNYGADGAGTTAYALSVTNPASGLATAQGDHAITLVQVGATVQGQYTDAGGTHTAFTVSVASDGKMTVVQNVA